MTKLEQLDSKILKLQEQLQTMKKEQKKLAAIEKREAERKAYQERVEEALKLIELAKSEKYFDPVQTRLTCSMYEYLKKQLTRKETLASKNKGC